MDATRVTETSQQYEQLSAELAQARSELAEAQQTVAQLSLALESNRDIGAAVGILMALRRVTRQQAFDLLRSSSQALNIKLRSLAHYVIDTGTLPAEGAAAPEESNSSPHRMGGSCLAGLTPPVPGRR
jgi:hypothetical protein